MMKPEACRVIIEGAEGCKARGLLHGNAQDGSFKVSFRYDGDSVTVEQMPGGLHYARRGAQFVDVVFKEGRASECRIGNRALSGSYMLHTDMLKIVWNDNGIDVFVGYRPLQAGDSETLIKMRICKGDCDED